MKRGIRNPAIQNVLIGAITFAVYPMTVWISDRISIESLSFIGLFVFFSMNIIEIAGFRLKMLSIKRSEISIGAFLVGILFLVYFLVANIPYVFMIGGDSYILTLGVNIICAKFIYYGYLLSIDKPRLSRKKVGVASDVLLTIAIAFTISFYLYGIRQGVQPDMNFGVVDVLWAMLPATVIFVPLRFPFIFEDLHAVTSSREAVFFVLSLIWVGFTISLQMFI